MEWTRLASDEVGTVHGALRMAASVLAHFNLEEIVPFGKPSVAAPILAQARERLCRDSETVNFAQGRAFLSLRDSVRRAALRTLGTRARMQAALLANPRPNTPTQRVFESFISGKRPEIQDLTLDELAASLAVTQWLDGIVDDAPAKTEIERQLGIKEITERLDRLSGREFLGREADVAAIEALLAKPHEKPLLVHGPGGVGKSTLVARLARSRFPDDVVVWLDADRPSYDFTQPDVILNEIVRQVIPQLPGLEDMLTDLHASTRSRILITDMLEQSKEADASMFIEARFAKELAEALGRRSMLIVLDTFEEIQLLGNEVEFTWATLLSQLQDVKIPSRIHAILCGRSKPLTSGLRDRELHGLEPQNARELLERLTPVQVRAQLPDGAISTIADAVGGNPLSLRLAARALETGGGRAGMVSSLDEVQAIVRTERVQGMLYGRILSHLRSEEARKVALPGLVVRLLTPEVIQEVLAGPCNLNLREPGNANHIMTELAREVALLEPDPGGGLRHRQDVRHIMMRDLLSHIPAETVKVIDQNAIEFWRMRNGAQARAEELYHRLRREESRVVLEERWLPEAAPYLRSALEEISPRERLWLAEKLDISVDSTLRHAAGLATWEAQAERAARRLIRGGNARRALAVLHERDERSDRSPLYAIEGEVLRVLGRNDEAREVALRGSSALAGAGAFNEAVELRLLAALIDESADRLESALQEAEAAARLSDSVHDPIIRLRPLVTQIRLLRKLGPDRDPQREQLRNAASLLATPDVIERLSNRKALLREIVAELGSRDALILRAGIQALGLDTRTASERRMLAEALAGIEISSDASAHSEKGGALDEVASWLGIERSDVASIERWLKVHGGAALTGRIAEQFAAGAIAKSLYKNFADFYRVGVESAVKRDWM